MVFKNLYNRFFRKKTKFYNYLYQILGFYPENLFFYELAFKHKSKFKSSNERLEFLGDALLDAIISEEIYHKFPNKNEGELSQLRSKIASRTFLNHIGKQLNLDQFLQYQANQTNIVETNILGNTLEALIGAIFLDGEYKKTKQFIVEQIFEKHIKWKELEAKTTDFKSKILQFAQKTNKKLEFVVLNKTLKNNNKYIFEVSLKLDNEIVSRGKGSNKKQAQQTASKNAFYKLDLN